MTFSLPPGATLLNQLIFLISGVFHTLGAQWLAYHGVSEPRTGILPSTLYIGMALCRFSPGYKYTPVSLWLILPIALLDLSGGVCSMAAVSFTGSGLYQTIYSNVVVCSAIISFFALGRTYSFPQWSGLIVLVSGLALSSRSGGDLGDSVVFGICLTIVATVLYACVYVANERVLTKKTSYGPPPNPIHMCSAVGQAGCIILGIWMVLVTVPNWHNLVSVPFIESNTPVMPIDSSSSSGPGAIVVVPTPTIGPAEIDPTGHVQQMVTPTLFVWLGLVICSLTHNASYFMLLKDTGAVSAGVLQGLRAILVFALSHLMFCDRDYGQCYTDDKALSTAVVITGLLIYAIASSKAPAKPSVESIEVTVSPMNSSIPHHKPDKHE